MEITRGAVPTARGAAEWFTGEVYMDPVAAPTGGSHVAAVSVHFAPGARSAWHTHPHGQTLWITQGTCRCQRRGGPVEVLHTGDRVFFAPGEDHWHGAAEDCFMTHLAIHEVDEHGAAVHWGPLVTDEEYAGATP
ncbi:MAG: cupin domain-containing protein [Thermoleophilia bacterium]